MKKMKQKSQVRRHVKNTGNTVAHRRRLGERHMRRSAVSLLPRIVVVSICMALLLVVFIMARLPVSAHAHLPAKVSIPSSPLPAGTGGLLRFTDPINRTALSVQTNSDDPHYGVFTFTSPTGEQYYGGNAKDLFSQGNDVLVLQFPGSFYTSLVGGNVETFGGPGGVGAAIVTLGGTINLANNLAEAVLTDFTSHQRYIMKSAPEPQDEGTAVDTFNTAVTGQSSQLFTLVSRFVSAGYDAASFNRIMQSQFQSVGRIISITHETPSQPATNPAGITYFTVVEHVTHLKNDQSKSSDTLIAVFILEDGQWKFWFSHRI